MRDYELMVVLVPHMDEEALSGAVDRINRYIAERGGAVVHQERREKRKLAYAIRNYREGNLVLTRFQLESPDTRQMEANLKLSEDVLRHLLIRIDEKVQAETEKPQAAVGEEVAESAKEAPVAGVGIDIDEKGRQETPPIENEAVSVIQEEGTEVESPVEYQAEEEVLQEGEAILEEPRNLAAEEEYEEKS